MKKADLILTSDWHLRETIPTCRTDDFWETQWKKVEFVSKLQHEHGCPVLHAGDLFHHWKPSPYLLSYTMAWLPDNFNSIYGQHDLPQHSWENREKSGINTLSVAGTIKVLPGTHFGQIPEKPSFEVHIPTHPIGSHEVRKILVWHKMVWQGKKPWPECTDPNAVALLKKYKEYDFILSGDNHKPFTEEYEGRLLVNPGSLSRQSADQIDHLPRVYLYHASDNTVDACYLPIDPKAVSREHIAKNEDRDGRVEAFISKLDGDWAAGMSFEENLKEFLQRNEVRDSVKDIIYKAIEP